MFKRIVIEMAGPICQCKSQNLSWGIDTNKNGRSGITIGCDTCDTKLKVSHSQFVAAFSLDKDYPEKNDTKKDAKILKLIQDDEKKP